MKSNSAKGYVKSNISGVLVFMHHMINGFPMKPLETDHINRDSLDNQRHNLRVVIGAVNRSNRNKYKHSNRIIRPLITLAKFDELIGVPSAS